MSEIDKSSLVRMIAKTSLTIGGLIAAYKIYGKIFSRTERPDYNITPGLFDYERVKDVLPREEIIFKSKKEKLQGYYYKCDKPLGLVVLAHGFKSGADDYLPITMYLVKNGFNVFTYDGTGVYNSTGKSTIGFVQHLVDLDYALEFIKTRRDMSRLPLFLLGHSCGGFAVNSVLAIHKKVKACASISAVNDAYHLLLDMGYQYAGSITNEGPPKEFLDEYQKILFGKYCEYTSFDAIKDTKVPLFIAHGINDETISFNHLSLISHRDEINNRNVEYYFGTDLQGGHDSIWHSNAAIRYKNEIDKQMKSFKKEYDKKVELNKTVNHALYSEINYELFDSIINFFKQNI